MTEITHRMVETNGIRMHVAEQGAGPLVLLCHGFPESWYSWRHQLAALAAAGFHAVAPDMRGYGQTDAPAEIEEYTLLPPGRRHGRPGRRAGRDIGGDRRARLGRAGGLARRAAAPRPLPRRDRPQRAVPAARLRAAHDGHAADR